MKTTLQFIRELRIILREDGYTSDEIRSYILSLFNL